MTAAGVRGWIEGDVARIRLDQPERLNPLGPAEWLAIRTHLAEAEDTAGVRAVVLDATGRYFCAGNDLRVVTALADRAAAREYFLDTQLPTLRLLAASPLPVLCAIGAPTAGGGIELAMVCDLVLASATATFALPETRVGLFATTVLAAAPYVFSRSALQHLALSGDAVDAREAMRLGLVHEVAEPGDMPAVLDRALAAIRRAAPASVAATKAALNGPLLAEGFPRMRAALEHLCDHLLFSPDGRAGLAGFRARSLPAWTTTTASSLPTYAAPVGSRG